ncbi:serine hydrolase [Phytohabitans sp. ZYX-F-186]|uniref:Serine hydrolase n=1 Tax=Phytohabitans maris TaxID=3071409 RepID=A0ABU0ZHY3_9ACTN|nr:serine hydrolase [Phytohabitans sp. ZYX-F-186]MDQ7906643.1 serine hydrolase [Phytohabitans sp. ZYX-F-186]
MSTSQGSAAHWVAGQRPVASSPPAKPPPPVRVRVDHTGFLSWALLDRRSGSISGSGNLTAPSDTMSMVKAWIAADYLRTAADEEISEDRLRQLRIMIRDSDNTAAQALFELVGRRASIERLIATCGLTESSAYGNWWSRTTVSARDTVRLGACIADGRAAGPRWTGWLLDEMRQVRGAGDFGVRLALPDPGRVAIKNGWLLRDDDRLWHISCLAIAERWVLGVLLRYPAELGFEYGTDLCENVGRQAVV